MKYKKTLAGYYFNTEHKTQAEAEAACKHTLKSTREARAYHGRVNVTKKVFALLKITEMQNKDNFFYIIEHNWDKFEITENEPEALKRWKEDNKKKWNPKSGKVGNHDIMLYCGIRTKGAKIIMNLDGSFRLIPQSHPLYSKKKGLSVVDFKVTRLRDIKTCLVGRTKG